MKWALAIGCIGAVGGLIGYRDGGGLSGIAELALVGLIYGAAGPWIIFRAHESTRKHAMKDAPPWQALEDWFARRGYTWVGDDISVNDGPIVSSWTIVTRTSAIRSYMSGFWTLIYNSTVLENQPPLPGVEPHSARRVLCLSGPRLPVSRLYVTRASFQGSLMAAVEGESRAWREGMKLIKTESTEFNDLFNVLVDAEADEVWIRRVFDPHTIDEMIQHKMWVPEISYWDGCFWLWEYGHYSPDDIDQLYAWQYAATNLAAHLTRIR